MTGERIAVYWRDTGDYMGEIYLDAMSMLVARPCIMEDSEALFNVLEAILSSIGLPETFGDNGYPYQPGPDEFLRTAVEAAEGHTFLGRPVAVCIERLLWCPYVPLGAPAMGPANSGSPTGRPPHGLGGE